MRAGSGTRGLHPASIVDTVSLCARETRSRVARPRVEAPQSPSGVVASVSAWPCRLFVAVGIELHRLGASTRPSVFVSSRHHGFTTSLPPRLTPRSKPWSQVLHSRRRWASPWLESASPSFSSKPSSRSPPMETSSVFARQVPGVLTIHVFAPNFWIVYKGPPELTQKLSIEHLDPSVFAEWSPSFWWLRFWHQTS